ncbi:MAG: NUDIX domain-containing protein, partial [Gaiellales bacterium]
MTWDQSSGGPPDMTLRARAVIPDTEGNVLLDRTHDPAKEGFYWFPGGGVEPGETAEEAVKRELIEEAALQIDVLKPLYLSENLFVESGEYRHEVILYFL